MSDKDNISDTEVDGQENTGALFHNSFKDMMNDVVAAGSCCECGSCVLVCPHNVIDYVNSKPKQVAKESNAFDFAGSVKVLAAMFVLRYVHASGQGKSIFVMRYSRINELMKTSLVCTEISLLPAPDVMN